MAVHDIKEGLQGESGNTAKRARLGEAANVTECDTEIDSSDTELDTQIPDTLD